MSRCSFVVVCLAANLCLAGTSFRAFAEPSPLEPDVAQFLGLGPDQQSQIRQIDRDTQRQMVKLEADERLARIDLEEAMEKPDDAKEARVEEIAKELGRVAAERIRAEVLHEFRVAKALTSEQRERLRGWNEQQQKREREEMERREQQERREREELERREHEARPGAQNARPELPPLPPLPPQPSAPMLPRKPAVEEGEARSPAAAPGPAGLVERLRASKPPLEPGLTERTKLPSATGILGAKPASGPVIGFSREEAAEDLKARLKDAEARLQKAQEQMERERQAMEEEIKAQAPGAASQPTSKPEKQERISPRTRGE
ncbi:MAG: hypothetical protein NTW86_11455 [Candidatus Sumerlaeota bacterium]|nr:hypothetical protein [Candidatus Sumerlaeota bacterium]